MGHVIVSAMRPFELARRRTSKIVVVAATALFGCQAKSSGPAVPDASLEPESRAGGSLAFGANGGSVGGGNASDTKPRVVEALAMAAEGTARPLSLEQPNAQLSPDSRFELVMLPRMADVRVRLFDESDRIIASNDELEIGSKTRYLLAPAEPLATGSDYTLVVDGLRAELPTAASGATGGIVRIALSTVGEKPPPRRPTMPLASRGKKSVR